MKYSLSWRRIAGVAYVVFYVNDVEVARLGVDSLNMKGTVNNYAF